MPYTNPLDLPVDQWTSSEFLIDAGKLGLSRPMCERWRPMPEWHPLDDASSDNRLKRALAVVTAMVRQNDDLGHSSAVCELTSKLDMLAGSVDGAGCNVAGEGTLSFASGVELHYSADRSAAAQRRVSGRRGPYERFEYRFYAWRVTVDYYGRGEFFLEFNDYYRPGISYSFHSASDFRLPGTCPVEGAVVRKPREWSM